MKKDNKFSNELQVNIRPTIIVILLFIVILGSFVINRFIINDYKINNPSINVKEELNGIYKNGENTLKLICVDCENNDVFFLIDELTGNKYSLNYKDGVLIAWGNDGLDTKGFNAVIKITKSNKDIIVESENEIKNGTYNRVSNYTFAQFYKEVFGNDDYIKTPFNGEFDGQGDMISLYQKDENTVFFDGDVEGGHWNFNLTIEGNKATGNYLYYNVEIEVNDESLTLRKYEDGNLKKEAQYKKESILSSKVIALIFFHN